LKYLIIVGIKKFTLYLAEDLSSLGYKVSIIDHDQEKCNQITKSSSFSVIKGEGTERSVLEEAGIRKCEKLLALTGSDAVNLMICEIARTEYDVKKTLAWLNNPHHETNLSLSGGHHGYNIVDNLISEIKTSLVDIDAETYIKVTRMQELIRKLYRKVELLKGMEKEDRMGSKNVKGLIQGYEDTAKMLEDLLNFKVFVHRN
jgi:trk system potassium uptake protein